MTDPTADAAKLLPCPFCGGEGEPVLWSGNEPFPVLRVRCKECRTEVDSRIDARHLWNTRPQPAPPEGEPNFGSAKWRSQLAQRLAEEVWEIFANGGFPAGQFTESVYRHLLPILNDRLGLAARPKVEGASKWSDYFSERGQLRAKVADLEAKLAEREAELAKARDALADAYDGCSGDYLKEAAGEFYGVVKIAIDESDTRQQATKEKP